MTNKSRTDFSMLNALTGIGGYFVNFLVGIICRMIFARVLAADYLGVNGLFTNILTMLSLTELGIGSAIGYALYKPIAINDKDKIASLMAFYAKCYKVIGITVGILGLCLMPFLGLLIQETPNITENLYVIYLMYLFNTSSSYFFSYRGALLTATQQNYIVVGVNYLITIIQSIVQILVLLITKSFLLYLLVLVVGVLVYNIIISSIAKKKFPYIAQKNIQPLESSEKKSLISNVKALTIWKLSGLLVNQTDNIIITYFNGLATVGFSSNYTLLSTNINTLLNMLFNSITASVGNHNALESNDQKYALFNTINLANFWLYGWASVGILVCSTDIVRLLFGESYALGIEIPCVIALNFYMVGMQNAVWTYKNTMGIFRQGRYLLIITAAINLLVSILLGKIWGLFGILLATAVSRLFTNTWYDPYAIHKYGFNRSVKGYYAKYVMYALLIIFTGCLCFGICSVFTFPLIINIVLKFLVCCIVPNLVFFICFRKTKEFVRLMGMATSILSKMKRVFNRN